MKVNQSLARVVLLFAAVTGFSVHATGAEVLGLDEYIRQIREGNDSVKASVEATQGARLRADDVNLMYTPMFFANAQMASDGRQTNAPSFMGTKTLANNYSAGLSQTTKFGMTAKLSYNLQYTEIQGASPTLLPQNKFYDAKPMIELSQSLLKNGFGRDSRALADQAESSAMASSYAESFKIKLKVAEAESAYWRLVFARQAVEVQKESLERSQKLKDWNERRMQSQLGDKADYLQSEAAYQSRKLELQNAEDEAAAAARAFNTLRGIVQESVSEELVKVSPDETAKLKLNKISEEPRDDVKAAMEQIKLADASARAGYEKAVPVLDVFGNYAYNGREADISNANSTAFKGDHPVWTVGLKFVTSLNLGMASDIRQGYTREKYAAELNFARKQFEERQEWKDLSTKFEDAKKRYMLTREIERIQQQKLEYEKGRFSRGRTTTYQVLMFEQDFAQSQLARIRVQSEVLQLASQLKTYGEI